LATTRTETATATATRRGSLPRGQVSPWRAGRARGAPTLTTAASTPGGAARLSSRTLRRTATHCGDPRWDLALSLTALRLISHVSRMRGAENIDFVLSPAKLSGQTPSLNYFCFLA
jgi:hypothetical protein